MRGFLGSIANEAATGLGTAVLLPVRRSLEFPHQSQRHEFRVKLHICQYFNPSASTMGPATSAALSAPKSTCATTQEPLQNLQFIARRVRAKGSPEGHSVCLNERTPGVSLGQCSAPPTLEVFGLCH